MYPAFAKREFVRQACTGLDALELLDRGKHISRALEAHLPASYPAAIDVLVRSLGPEHASDELVGAGMAPFFYLPHVLFVAERGLDHFDESMQAQYELTKRFSAESSIRPYIAKYPEQTFAVLRQWTRDKNPHVRRLVSEGTRLRLPWAMRVAWLDEHPERVLELLELLKDDPATLVRRSVANNLNDLGKVRPDLLARTCAAWLEDASAERRALVEHALRSAVKRGDAGRTPPAWLRKEAVGSDRECAHLTKARRDRRASLDRICRAQHVTRAAGSAGGPRRAFRESQRQVIAESVQADAREAAGPRPTRTRTSVSLAVHTTRKPQPGRHAVDVIINGTPQRVGAFEVVDARRKRAKT